MGAGGRISNISQCLSCEACLLILFFKHFPREEILLKLTFFPSFILQYGHVFHLSVRQWKCRFTTSEVLWVNETGLWTQRAGRHWRRRWSPQLVVAGLGSKELHSWLVLGGHRTANRSLHPHLVRILKFTLRP